MNQEILQEDVSGRLDPQSLTTVISKARPHTILLLLLAIGGFLLLYLTMQLGPIIASDSVAYITAARNWLAGRGLSRLSGTSGTKPMTHYAPLLSMAIAGLQLLGLEALNAVRFLNSFLFGASVFLVGTAIWSVTANRWFSLAGACLMLTSPIMIEQYAWALSEPIYLFFGLLCLFLLAEYQRTGNLLSFFTSTASAALTLTSRYIGVTVLLTAIVCILLNHAKKLAVKIKETLVFVVIATLPIILWLLRNLRLTGSATNRNLVLHSLTPSHLKQPFSVVWGWLVPFEFGYPALWAMVVLTAIAGLVLIWTAIRYRQPLVNWIKSHLGRNLPSILSIYILCYGVSIFASISLIDFATPIDNRITSPIYLSLLVLTLSILPARILRLRQTRLAEILSGMLIVVFFASNTLRSTKIVNQIATVPQGFTALAVQQEGGLEEVRAIPAHILIYTNNLEVLSYIYGRGGHHIPEQLDPITMQPREGYIDAIEKVRQVVEKSEAIFVFFAVSSEDLEPRLIDGFQRIVDRNGVLIYASETWGEIDN